MYVTFCSYSTVVHPHVNFLLKLQCFQQIFNHLFAVGDDKSTHTRKASLRYPFGTPTSDENGSRECLAEDSNAVSFARDRKASGESIEMNGLKVAGVEQKQPQVQALAPEGLELKTVPKDAQLTAGEESWRTSRRSSAMPIAPIGSSSFQVQSCSLTVSHAEHHNANLVAEPKITGHNGSEAEESSQEENWHVLGSYLNVVSSSLYVIANVVVFCVYLVPLFSMCAINNELTNYISK